MYENVKTVINSMVIIQTKTMKSTSGYLKSFYTRGTSLETTLLYRDRNKLCWMTVRRVWRFQRVNQDP